MKIKLKWIALLIVVLALAAGVMRAISSRAAQKEALALQQEAQKQQAAIELAPSDVVQVKTIELTQTVPLSGSVKATSSAFVKARVAGELLDLRVREGDVVRAGQVIARIDPTETAARLRQAQQQVEATKAQVDIARRSYENNKSLVDQGFISKTALETSASNLAAAEANFRAAVAASDLALKSEQDTLLKAPINGLVAQRLAQPGERVAVDARIIEIVDIRQMELEANLSAADALQVKVGQTAQLAIEGLSTSSAAGVTSAKVLRINPSTVAGSRAVLAYLSFENAEGLRQGMFAQGKVYTGKFQALAVPLTAVRTDKPQPYVQLVVNGKVVHQTVQKGGVGEFNEQLMVAVKGLDESAEVLVASVGPLREGTPVGRLKTGQAANAGNSTPSLAASASPVEPPAKAAPGEKGGQ